MLKFLGGLGKGWATISGLILTAAGIIGGVSTNGTGASGQVGEAVNTILTGVPAIVAAVGALLAAFGFGRKTGVEVAGGIKENLK